LDGFNRQINPAVCRTGVIRLISGFCDSSDALDN
jgi:hypothetical protein